MYWTCRLPASLFDLAPKGLRITSGCLLVMLVLEAPLRQFTLRVYPVIVGVVIEAAAIRATAVASAAVAS